MNKQELIDEIKRIHASAIGRSHVSTHPLYSDGVADTCSDVIKLLEQLDEPQKPVVPKFVADFIEEYRDGGATLYEMMDSSEDEVYTWLFGNPRIETENERQLLFAQAYVVGYEVEKELLYVMPVPHVSFPAHYCVKDDHVSFRQGNAQKFTQAELDKYFPDIKQFAVPVEEVEEG
ncbi:DUF1642 domain-containing protein [Enterococcus sp. DIV0180]|uniref:DUF1642 domain-containing protein n=1 Tax=Enterococcus sp. DIV0180 TaxID=2774749 RepID=UPI003D2FACFD